VPVEGCFPGIVGEGSLPVHICCLNIYSRANNIEQICVNKLIKRTGVLVLLAFLAGLGYWAFTQLYMYPASINGMPFERFKSASDSGFDQAKLSQLARSIENSPGTTGVVILHQGKVVFEYGDIAEVSYLASSRKSVLSMLYGNPVENGIIDLNEQIGEIGISEADGLLPSEKQATVNDVITSRSGVFHVAANGGYDKKNFLTRGAAKPGDYFVYNNWDFNVAGHIFETKTGKTIYQALENQLAIPLGFQDWNIKNQKKYHNREKSQYPAYHMYLSTRDMAKIGQLMLNEGLWNGKQLISSDWIRKITSPVTPTNVVNERYGRTKDSDVQFSYGYMWWLVDTLKGNPAAVGGYTAAGYGGQWITVFPMAHVVIAHKSKLSPLASLGLMPGGTSPATYWNIVDQVLNAKSEVRD
jgi:CubicO group peptidase (beta-lactamase class C family)